MRRLHTHLGIGWLLSACAFAAACNDGDATILPGPTDEGGIPDEPVDELTVVPGDGASEFVSKIGANGVVQIDRESGDNATGANPNAASLDVPPTDSDGGAQRAISEADILQLSGDRLYALSRYSGLSIIDVSNPASLRMEGVYRSAAEPFEMYVEDGIVFAMFNSWYNYECDADGACGWQTTSRMQALDTRDPSNIRLLADAEVPGNISDSRRVGDVLYLATIENGYCWGCDDQSNTRLTSFNVADPTQFAVVDQLAFPIAENGYSWERSITVTDQRIYIAGADYGPNGLVPATVQTVDISDAAGDLVAGARFAVAGPVQSRWQMDEFEGVFRIITQPGGWGSTIPPVVQTFNVASSQQVTPLGSLTVDLPRPNEVLQSVRFDGTRAFAITAERQDPLFTFDLTDPANPLQLGQLEMPGWVYHMEPRGNRIYALGFDPENPDGSLNVSLFDVSNLNTPTLLSRVAFGGDWGSFAEGQNQIHKAFSILDEQGLILVPFSGSSYDEATCEYDYGSGIQLIDFSDAALTRRGAAPQVGNARRAFLHRDRLFGVGDNTVQTFNIDNRDAPVLHGEIDVARNVSTVRVLGDQLMRFGSDWQTNQTILDLTPVARASSAEPAAEVDLSALFGEDSWSCSNSASWSGQVFTRGNYAYVPRYNTAYDRNYSYSEQQLTLYIVDMSDAQNPRAVGSFAVEPATNGDYITDIVQTDNTLLIGRSHGNFVYDYAKNDYSERPTYHYDVVDLSDPVAPRVATRFEVPEVIAGGGWGRFIGGCSMDMGWGWYGYGYGGYGNTVALTDGDLVVSQHSEAVPGSDGDVKYYLDRIDVSNPNAPVMLPPINIPGTAVHFNGATGELVTVDYQSTLEAASDPSECYNRGAWGEAQYIVNASGTTSTPTGECNVWRRSINSLVLEGDRAVRKSQLLLDRTRRTGNIAVSDSRIFYTTTVFPSTDGRTAYVDYAPGAEVPATALPPLTPVTLEALQLNAGELARLPSHELRRTRDSYAGYGQLYARGDRAFEIFDQTVTVVDTVDPSQATRLSHELPNWSCSSLEVSDDTA
jgi:hypothetical protein